MINFFDELKPIFFGKARKTLQLFKKFPSVLTHPIKLLESLSMSSVKSSEQCNIGLRLYNLKFDQHSKNIFFEKARQTFALSKIYLPKLSFSINFILKHIKSLNQFFGAMEY